MRKGILIGLMIGALAAVAAVKGITTQQAQTAAPATVLLSTSADTEGSSLAFARADHVHRITGPNCTPAQVLSSDGGSIGCVAASNGGYVGQADAGAAGYTSWTADAGFYPAYLGYGANVSSSSDMGVIQLLLGQGRQPVAVFVGGVDGGPGAVIIGGIGGGNGTMYQSGTGLVVAGGPDGGMAMQASGRGGFDGIKADSDTGIALELQYNGSKQSLTLGSCGNAPTTPVTGGLYCNSNTFPGDPVLFYYDGAKENPLPKVTHCTAAGGNSCVLSVASGFTRCVASANTSSPSMSTIKGCSIASNQITVQASANGTDDFNIIYW